MALISSDVEQTVRFYQDVLGFPLTEVMENRDYPGSTHFFFDAGNGNAIAFFDLPGLDLGPYAEVLGGLHHLCISITRENWLAARARLAGGRCRAARGERRQHLLPRSRRRPARAARRAARDDVRQAGRLAVRSRSLGKTGDNAPLPQEAPVLGFILSMLIVGLIAGFLARALVPGPDPMSVPKTILLGIVGSFIGGFIGYVLFGKDGDEGALQPSGLIGAIVGAVIALLIYRATVGKNEHRGAMA